MLQHLAPLGEVAARVEQDTLGFQPVPAGSARFLLVVLDGARRTGVNDIANVRAVDAHAERHRGDHDVGPLLEECLLMTAPHLVWEPRVIRQGMMTESVEPARQLLDLLARHTVDDAGFALVSLEDPANLILEAGASKHTVDEVGSVERADQHLGIAQGQLRDDVVTHLPRRGRSEGVDGQLWEFVAEPAESSKFRAELVAPLTDAVGFVDCDEPDTPAVKPSAKRLASLADQPFGGDVEQPAPPGVEIGIDLATLGRGQRAIERRGGHAARHQTVHLIFHQRDEWRDHEPEAVVGTDQRRHLEAQRLASSSGQHDDTVTPVEVRLDRGALKGAELAVAPVSGQRVVERGLVHGLGSIGLGQHT